MKFKIYLLVFLTCFCTFFKNTSFAQSEEDLDAEFLSDNNLPEDKSENANQDNPKWDFFGFIQIDNHYALQENHEDNHYTIKEEGRIRLNSRYGTEYLYAKAVIDGYYYQTGSEENNPRENGNISAQELYLAGGETFQFKLGKQLYQWGTADAFNVTNYLDQSDQREFLATDKNDRYQGVNSLSLKFILGEFALETVFSPHHKRNLSAAGFWKFEPESKLMGGNLVEVKMSEADNDSSSLNDSAYSARFGGTFGVLDFHFVYYNGMNRNNISQPLFSREDATSDIYLNMKNYYERIQAYGLDLAFTLDKLSVRAEATYSPNMPGMINPEISDYITAYSAISAGTELNYKITEVEDTNYLAYTIGADYNLWGDNGLILLEWTEARYVKQDKYIEPLFSKLLLIRIEDKFLNEHIFSELNTTLRLDGKDKPGYSINYKLGWDFKIGLTLEAGCYIFEGNDDELFSLLENKDMVYLKGKMEF